MKLACPNCGSGVKFIPRRNQVFCDHCSTYTNVTDISFKQDITNSSEGNYEQTCSSCGAKFVTLDNTLIKRCNFCGSENIANRTIRINLEYKKIIPFKYSREDIIELFKKDLTKNKYYSTDYFNVKNISEITGLYVPLAVGKFKIKASSSGIVQSYTESLSPGNPQTRVNFINDYKFDGNGYAIIPADTSKNIPDNDFNCLFPFYIDESVDFSPYYLAGFSTFTGDDFYYSKVKSSSKTLIYHLYNEMKKLYSNVMGPKIIKSFIANNNLIKLEEISIEKYLVPIWLCSYNQEGTLYTFAVNGQTGKIISRLPRDKKRLWREEIHNILIAIAMSLILPSVLFGAFYISGEHDETSLKGFLIGCIVYFIFISSLFIYYHAGLIKKIMQDKIEIDDKRIKLFDFYDVTTQFGKPTINKIDKTQTSIYINDEKI